MTDITDQDRRAARQWADGIVGGSTEIIAAARVILATVDAPAPTLAEELRHIAEHWEEWATDTITSAIRAAADRADQTDQERDEAKKERDHFFREVENVRNWKEQLLNERDEARAEVERLNREQDRLCAQVQGLVRRDGDHNSEVRMLTEERDEARAEVERLTAERGREKAISKGWMEAHQKLAEHHAETLERAVQKDAESSDMPNPADVNPGEAWEVIATDPAKIFGGTTSYNTVAFRMADRWIVSRNGYPTPLVVPDDCIRLVRRHVPAPRAITNPNELDRAKRGTVIRDAAGVVCERDPMGDDWSAFASLANQRPRIVLPATVLWEPATP